MINRLIYPRIKRSPKNILLLGARQVGKSTLIRLLKPDKIVNLMDEELYLSYAKDAGRLKRELAVLKKPSLIAIDEIQRIPSLLNAVQLSIDEGAKHRFVLSGSSARKLKRGHANLLPGRIIIEHLDPLSYWELDSKNFDLDKALQIGSLPGIYLSEQETARDVLSSYSQTYLREEIQNEAVVQQIGAYARFLDIAAEASGQWINYSKLSSDAEIPKETLRRFFQILEDTLIVYRVPPFKPTEQKRRVGQKERFVFFDLGVRNALLGIHRSVLSPLEKGVLFEQWIFLQLTAFIHIHKKNWKISSFRTDTGIEVDWILDVGTHVIAVECKVAHKVTAHDFNGLQVFERFCKKPVEKVVVHSGDAHEKFDRLGTAMPYGLFLKDTLPTVDGGGS